MLLFNVMYYLRISASLAIMLMATLISVESVAEQGIAEENDLASQMSADEFKARGLHKLTDAELKALAEWIDQQRDGRPEPVARASAPASTPKSPAQANESVIEKTPAVDPVASFGQEQIEQEPDASVPESISSRIVGEFRGWDGRTVFRLHNGQIWRQRVGGKYRSALRTDPEVVVEKGRFGYYLKLVESGRSVGVKRIR